MHYHPETLLVLHKERQDRFEAEAARYALLKALRRRRRRSWWRRPIRQPAFLFDTRPSQMNAEGA